MNNLEFYGTTNRCWKETRVYYLWNSLSFLCFSITKKNEVRFFPICLS